jgi:HK97 family phage prohead protease
MPKTIDDKLLEGRQYRGFTVSKENLRTLEDGQKVVEGYATVFNTPYVLYQDSGMTIREQIAPEAFDGCDLSDVIMQYDHMGHVYARTANKTLEVAPDDIGLKTRSFLDGTTIGRQLYEEIDGGYTTKMSFGFIIGERRKETVTNEETGHTDVLVTITRITKLFDVSAVSLPANDATSISARNLCDGVIAEVREECLQRRRKLTKIKLLLED